LPRSPDLNFNQSPSGAEMLTQHSVLMQEDPGDDGWGAEEGFDEQPSGEAVEDLSEEPQESAWLRDIDEDTGYNILQQARQFPDHLKGLESRLYGRLGPVVDKLNTLEKSLGSRTSVNAERIKEALDKYDGSGALSEALVPALQEALQTQPLDEAALSPYLSPMQEQMSKRMGESLVLSHYSPEEIGEMIPDVNQDGKFVPQNQRQKDFATWYSQQGYSTQEALNDFGPGYVRALRQFERWEKDRVKERTAAAGEKSGRLARGQQPSSQGRRPQKGGPQTAEDFFLAGFNEVD